MSLRFLYPCSGFSPTLGILRSKLTSAIGSFLILANHLAGFYFRIAPEITLRVQLHTRGTDWWDRFRVDSSDPRLLGDVPEPVANTLLVT
jgi:hypothetical protein